MQILSCLNEFLKGIETLITSVIDVFPIIGIIFQINIFIKILERLDSNLGLR